MKDKKFSPSFIIAIIIPILLGAVIIAILGFSPLKAYGALLKGAFGGKLSIGTTLEKFVSILLCGLAYCICTKVKFFNLGTEGNFYAGAIIAAGLGFLVRGVPAAVHIPICLIGGMLAGALWSTVSVLLRVFFNVNEACVTIMMNYIAIYLTSLICSTVWSAQTASNMTPALEPTARLYQFLLPSRANAGLFIALGVFILVFWLVMKSRWGYNIRSTGINPYFTDYVGINSKVTVIVTVMLSGGIAGLAGAVEIQGLYGTFMDEFATGVALDGMLASLIAKNDMKKLPFTAFFMAALKAGALGMQRATGIPKALVDALIAVFIILVVVDEMFKIDHSKFRNLFRSKKGGEKVAL